MFENLKADLQCYEGRWGCQGFWVMAVYRFGRWQKTSRSFWFRRPLRALYKILFRTVQVLTGIELPCETQIGKNLHIHHFGGIIISGKAVFGDNCHIRNGVTIGARNMTDTGAPRIGDNVNIGAGAVILGDIKIGNNAVIGANAVVVTDLPDDCTAVGIPAKVISQRID